MLLLHHIITAFAWGPNPWHFIDSVFTLSFKEEEIPRLKHLFSSANNSSKSVSGSVSPDDIDTLKTLNQMHADFSLYSLVAK